MSNAQTKQEKSLMISPFENLAGLQVRSLLPPLLLSPDLVSPYVSFVVSSPFAVADRSCSGPLEDDVGSSLFGDVAWNAGINVLAAPGS